ARRRYAVCALSCVPLRALAQCEVSSVCVFFNDTATTEIYTLSLHDALPILSVCISICTHTNTHTHTQKHTYSRSEEHTSELQSHLNLVCRLLLEKKKTS